MHQRTALRRKKSRTLLPASVRLQQGKARELTMVIGDLNTKVGSDNRNWEASMGTHSEGVINDSGEMFCDICESFELVIGERSTRTRNLISLHGDSLKGSLTTRSNMWLLTKRGGVHQRTPGCAEY